MMVTLHLFVFLCLCTRLGLVAAARVNRTIDDTNGDSQTGQVPVYRPISAWDDSKCSGCAIQPSASQAHDGTWTAATYNPGLGSTNISFSFEGVALYIYFILANNQGSGITTNTECNFTLDDKHAGFFNHTPSSSTALEYNALAFSVTGLEQKAHSMVISTSGVNYNVFVNFDYANYTYDEDAAATASGTATPSSASSSSTSSSDSSSTSGSSTGPIVGGVVGGLVALAALGLAVFFFLKRRRRTDIRHIPSHDDDGQPPMSMMTSPPDRYNGHSNNNSQSLLPLAGASDYNRDLEYNAYNSSYAPSEYNNPPTTFNPSDHERSSSYIPRDVVSSLPSGAIMMSAAAASTTDHYTSHDASSTLGLPSGAAAPAASIYSDRTRSSSIDQTDLRRTRQQALQAQMRAIQNEIAGLKPAINAGGSSRDEEMDDLKAQIAAMREQMKTLQAQQQSPWAQGLSDEPPPGYTPSEVGAAAPPVVVGRKS